MPAITNNILELHNGYPVPIFPTLWLKSLSSLHRHIHEFQQLAEQHLINDPYLPYKVPAYLNTLCRAISLCEFYGIPRETILAELKSARRICARSPFVRRLQTWPRGYPGDFETVEYIMRQENHAKAGSFEYWLEQNALNSDIVQQHRNKVVYQANTIRQALKSGIMKSGHKQQILILACGGCPDLRMVQQQFIKSDCQIVLNDMDQDAIDFACGKLDAIRDKIFKAQGNVLRCGPRLKKYGPYDLVVAGGLFDYLPEGHAKFLLDIIWNKLLRSGGKLLFTNIATGNPFRVWIEYFTNWKLIERSEAEVADLLQLSDTKLSSMRITREQTGLTLLVEVNK